MSIFSGIGRAIRSVGRAIDPTRRGSLVRRGLRQLDPTSSRSLAGRLGPLALGLIPGIGLPAAMLAGGGLRALQPGASLGRVLGGAAMGAGGHTLGGAFAGRAASAAPGLAGPVMQAGQAAVPGGLAGIGARAGQAAQLFARLGPAAAQIIQNLTPQQLAAIAGAGVGFAGQQRDDRETRRYNESNAALRNQLLERILAQSPVGGRP